MDQVDTLHVGRYMYWSEVLCCTITAHLRDFEVKAMGHRFLSHLLIAGCDIGVQISVRSFVRSCVRSSVNIYVEVWFSRHQR